VCLPVSYHSTVHLETAQLSGHNDDPLPGLPHDFFFTFFNHSLARELLAVPPPTVRPAGVVLLGRNRDDGVTVDMCGCG
jgi:hypothetical protein